MKLIEVLAILIVGVCLATGGARSQTVQIMDQRIATLENLMPDVAAMARTCQEDECEPPVCGGRLDTFRDLSNIITVLDRYLLLLNAEDALLTQSTDDAIANNDLSAAALEGARVAASMTHVTDQMLGAVVELNGIAGFVTSPSSDPEAIWEAAKDVNSIINRLYDGWAETGNQIESVRYNPELASGQGTGINLKSLEDAYIDIWAVGPKAAAELIPAGLRDYGSDGDPVQFVKDNTSNAVEVWATAKGLLKEVAKLEEARKMGSLMQEAGQGYVDRALPGLKGSMKKRVDAAIKEQQALVGEQKRATANAVAFGLTQVAARLVQNYYSREKLKAFRNRVSELRAMNKKAGDKYLDHIVERDGVRDRSRRVARLLGKVRSLADSLGDCAFRSCGGDYASLPMVRLSAVEKRNGNVIYGQGQKDLEPILSALVASLSSNIANDGGAEPEFPDGTNLTGPSFMGVGEGAACAECQTYHVEATGISRRIEMIKWRLETMEGEEDIAELRYQRNISLRDAEAWQAEYNRRTDGSLKRRLLNLTEDEMLGLSELGSQIRRATSRMKAVGQRIRALEASEKEAASLRRKLASLETQERAALDRLRLCNRNLCNGAMSRKDLLQSSPAFAAEAEKDAACRKPDEMVENTTFMPQSFCKPGFHILLSAGVGARVEPIFTQCSGVTSDNKVVSFICEKGDLFTVVENGRDATEAMTFEQAKAYARERNRYVLVEDDGRVYEMLEEEAQARLNEEYERLDACSQANNPLLEILDNSAVGVPVIPGVETIDQQARQLLNTPEIPDPFADSGDGPKFLGVGEGDGFAAPLVIGH